MKTLITASAAALLGAVAYGAPLTVSLDGVQGDGPLYVSVQTEAEYMQNAGTAGTIVQAPEPGAHEFTFDVPPGAYAVSIWHDDGNQVFDRDENGWPMDGWALSGTLAEGEPSFSDAAVTVGPDGASVSLSMIYPD
ncbi:DUF2141 domain-containing protein [Maricaulaceae bacterium MS644]